MNSLALWIVPPLVGAVIGYVTNAIAIKMLFRPLAEKRIFGLRLPFTPGILPRQRHQLADNIGRMVARELLTEDIIRERIRRNDFRLAIERSVSEYSGRFLSSPVGRFALVVPAVSDDGVAASLDSSDIARLLGVLAERFVSAPSFADIVSRAVKAGMAKLGEKSIAELVGGDRDALVLKISERLSSLVSSALAGTEALDGLARSAEDFAASLAAEGKSLGSVLPPDFAESVSRIVDAAYPALVEAGLRYVARRDVRDEIESRGRVFLRDAILRLNVFQRLFLSAAQYDRTLHEQMPEIVDDLLAHVAAAARGERSRGRFSEAVRDSAERFFSLPVGDAAAALGAEPKPLARSIALGIGRILASRGAGVGVARMLEKSVGEVVDEPLQRILEARVGMDAGALAEAATEAILRLAGSDPGPAVERAVDAFLADRGADSLAELFGIDAAAKEKMDRFLADRVVALIDDRITGALSTLDVRSLVSQRIDSLEMESVESIVLDILADQLRWINVFGAMLGALIGLSQVFVSIYLR